MSNTYIVAIIVLIDKRTIAKKIIGVPFAVKFQNAFCLTLTT